MKKMIIAFIAFSVGGLPLLIQASPESDLKAFRAFYKKRFPKVRFDEFANGLYALPGAKDRRAEWQTIMEFPPYEVELEKGKKFWEKNKLASCFKNGGRNIAQNYPKWNGKKVITLEGAINTCLKKKGKKPFKGKNLKKGLGVAVTAYMKSLSRGQRVKLDLRAPGMRKEYEYGKKFYWAKRGQLNFSCANCHVDNAGKLIRGNILSAGIGHGVGFPAYRSKWGGLGSIHRRYTGCNKQVRAKPLKPQSREYTAVELYETYMATGLPLTAPSQRF